MRSIKPKLDGAGSTLAKVYANAHPYSWSKREQDEFITVGVPNENASGSEINSHVAVYSFEKDNDLPVKIPEKIGTTCVGWCTDSIYAKWPGATGWEKLADCEAIGTHGQRVVEYKMYCPTGPLAPITSLGSDYTSVYFRNVAMTRVLVEDNTSDSRYPESVKNPTQACIDENNGQRWAIIRIAEGIRSEVPTFHLLVREIQGTSNEVVTLPEYGSVSYSSFIGSMYETCGFKNLDLLAQELITCEEFRDNSILGPLSAATILDFVEYERCNVYYKCTRDEKYIGTRLTTPGSGEGGPKIVASVSKDCARDYYPFFEGFVENPWPNQACTCESGLFVTFTKNGLGPIALDLRTGSRTAYADMCSYSTVIFADVTTSDLASKVTEAYKPDTSGGLWARYFGGSKNIWDNVTTKNFGMECIYPSDSIKNQLIPSEENMGRVGLYVNEEGGIVAYKTGEYVSDAIVVCSGVELWNQMVISRTHDTFPPGTGNYARLDGWNNTSSSCFCAVIGLENCSGVDTVFGFPYHSACRVMQFGEYGSFCNNFCGTKPISYISEITVRTGTEGVPSNKTSKIDTITLYAGDRNGTVSIIGPVPLTLVNGNTGTNIQACVNLNTIFEKDDDGNYLPDQEYVFRIPVKIDQDADDIEAGIYYPDPNKKGSKVRWIPFCAAPGLGYMY